MRLIMINYQRLVQNKLLGILLCLLLVVCSNKSHSQNIHSKLEEIAQNHGSPAIQVTYSKNNIKTDFAYGLKNTNNKDDIINTETRFQAASLTKVVAAYTFLRLMDKGIIALDEPLWNYYPYDRLKNTINKEKITARMILTHRSGLLNWEGDVPSDTWRATPLTLQHKPGEDYLYSGEGFYFLQETLEYLTGKSFKDLVEEEVLKPLDLKYSNIVWNDSLKNITAYGHRSINTARTMGMYRKANAAYTLYTTANDYTKFVKQAILEGKGLRKETHNLFLEKHSDAKKGNQTTPEDQFVPCALGMRMQINEVGTAYWHTGSNPGFRCFFIAYPETKEIVAGFMNTDTGFPIMKDLLSLFLPQQKFWAYDWRLGELD